MSELLIHLIYRSNATSEFDAAELRDILAASRRNNADAGLSGMLLYTDGTFFQVLEGPPAAVDRVFDIISQDPRHDRVTTIIRERIPARDFGEWTMGYVTATRDELAAAAGENDFFGQGSSLEQLDGGRAKKLLVAFRAGRWRADETRRAG